MIIEKSARIETFSTPPSTEVIESYDKRNVVIGALHEDELCTLYKQWQRPKMS